MTDADRVEDLDRVERELGVTLPTDYREFMVASGGVERDYGGSFWLHLWEVREIVLLNRGDEMNESYPGLVLIGSDGGGEGIGLDFRQTPPSVVLVNFVSAGWHEAIPQSTSFSEFMAQRSSGEEYRFERDRT